MKIIHHAAKNGDIARLTFLLRDGAAIDARDKHGLTGLMRAALAGQTEAVRFLLDQGAEVNGRKGDGAQGKGSTALTFAAREGHTETVRLLLDRGAAVAAVTGYGDYTALLLAAMGGHIGSVDALVGRGADLDHRDAWGNSALLRAMEDGHETVANRLRPLGASIGLAEAVVTGDTPRLIRLLESGAIPDERKEWGQTALMRAASRGNVDAVRVLLARGARVTDKAFFTAISRTRVDIARLFLKYSADANATRLRGVTALMLAANTGSEAMVRLLLSHRADPTPKDDGERTAADWAARRGHQNIAELLSETWS